MVMNSVSLSLNSPRFLKKNVSPLCLPKQKDQALKSLVFKQWIETFQDPHPEGLFLYGADRALINHVINQAIFHRLFWRHKEITVRIGLDFV